MTKPTTIQSIARVLFLAILLGFTAWIIHDTRHYKLALYDLGLAELSDPYELGELINVYE